MNRKERRRRDNFNQLQVALDNDWVKCNFLSEDVVQFRMKNKPKIDFILSESSCTNIEDNIVYRLSMKQFLKRYRRRRM